MKKKANCQQRWLTMIRLKHAEWCYPTLKPVETRWCRVKRGDISMLAAFEWTHNQSRLSFEPNDVPLGPSEASLNSKAFEKDLSTQFIAAMKRRTRDIF